jgi:hypothetical protein
VKNRAPVSPTDTALLILVIALQVVFLRIATVTVAVIAFGTALLFSLLISSRRKGVFRVVASILLITLPVLLVQLLFRSDISHVVAVWSVYVLRLITAALTARALLLLRGTTGIQRGITGLFSFLPRRFSSTIGSIVASSMYLLPVVFSHLKLTIQSASIRYGREGNSLVPSYPRILSAAFLNLADLPERRAEGMVIRGLVE